MLGSIVQKTWSRAIILVAVIPWARATGQVTTPRTDPVERWRDRQVADPALAQGDAPRADSLYRRLLHDDSADVQIWLGLATAELTRSRLASAESAFKRVFSGGYFPGQSALQVARLAARQGKRGDALDWLDSALVHRVTSRASFQRDSAFAPYREDPRFRRIAGMLPKRTFTRVEGWRYDLAFFVAEAKRVHVGIARPAFSQALATEAARLDRRIPSLSDGQILAGLQHLSTLLGDGHSGVYRRSLTQGRKRLPIDLYWFSEGLYVVGASDAHRDLIGCRVTTIGTLSADHVLSALAPYVPLDNDMRIVGFAVPYFLAYPLQLEAMGAITDTTHVTIGLLDAAGRARTVTLTPDDPRVPSLRLVPRDTGAANPLWLRNVATNIWETALPASHAVYMEYNAVADTPKQSIADFAPSLARELRDTTVRHLIVDLRRNGGGNSFLNDPLYKVIFGFAAGPNHHIWVIAGRHTFSAAQNFANYLERFAGAVFVGEPTGSRPNFTGENGEVILPYSHVIAEISNENHWSAFWEDERPWIAPGIPIPVSAADYFANRDAALDAVLRIVAQPNQS